MQSLATTFESRYETWASAKSYVRRTLLGRGPMSSGRGSIRRECLDHVIVFHEASLRRTLAGYFRYYHGTRTHISLAKDSPEPRPIQPHRKWDTLWRCRKWAGCTTATNDEPPEQPETRPLC